MSDTKKQEKPDPKSTRSSKFCLPLTACSHGPEPKEPTFSHQLIPKIPNTFFSRPEFLKPNRPTNPPSTSSVYRCLLITEILSVIFEYVRRFDDFPDSDSKWDRSSGKRTLASLARTCKAFSAPALDALWVRLDSLDPLIKVLPRRIWARKHYPFIVRMFMGEKQWLTFSKYAVRVKILRGPCWRVPASVQHNVFAALAGYPKATLPLLPNLNELVWTELKMSNLIDPSVSLIKYFAGPGITTVSLFLICWPNHVDTERAVLENLPNLCPNVTAFTAFFPRSSYNNHSVEIGSIVGQWPHLRVLRSCALEQSVMDTVMSKHILGTLSIELNNCHTAVYGGQLPSHVTTWSLGGNSTALCLRYFNTIQGSPNSFHLRIGADDSTIADMERLVDMLPTRLDQTRLRSLTIELTSSYWSTPAGDSFVLTLPLLTSISSFPALSELDLSTYCTAELDDKAYETWMAGWPQLKSLKMGVADVSKVKPVATVGAIVAVLRTCRQLETLSIAFDATLPPPSGIAQKDKRPEEPEGDEGMDKCQNEWGVTNHRITHLRVGYSPIEEDGERWAELAKCLKTVIPRLERIVPDRYPLEKAAHWAKLQDIVLTGR